MRIVLQWIFWLSFGLMILSVICLIWIQTAYWIEMFATNLIVAIVWYSLRKRNVR